MAKHAHKTAAHDSCMRSKQAGALVEHAHELLAEAAAATIATTAAVAAALRLLAFACARPTSRRATAVAGLHAASTTATAACADARRNVGMLGAIDAALIVAVARNVALEADLGRIAGGAGGAVQRRVVLYEVVAEGSDAEDACVERDALQLVRPLHASARLCDSVGNVSVGGCQEVPRAFYRGVLGSTAIDCIDVM